MHIQSLMTRAGMRRAGCNARAASVLVRRRRVFGFALHHIAAAMGLASSLAMSGAVAQPSDKVAHAIRVVGSSPRIDGLLDDATWNKASAIRDFSQQRPREFGTPSDSTIVYFAYDDDALYVAARMYRRTPEAISRLVTRRDAFETAERLSVTFDTHLDRRTGYEFTITAGGGRGDFRHTQDSFDSGKEGQFDPIWSSAAHVDSLGWTAEMRIPFAQLRFPKREEQRWGLNISRTLPDLNEEERWVVIPPRETGYISRFGTLTGIRGLRNSRPIELLPFVAGDATKRANRDAADPFGTPLQARVGMDAKFGVGSNLTIDATIAPDFGQVEADPAEVNLTAFETFFDERRPFFTEGSELLRSQGGNYFYSRRIGARPHGLVEGDYIDVPRASTILGAAKITGRLASRLSVGGLVAVTGAEHARSFWIDSGPPRRLDVEPRTAYAVMRMQQEVGRQASTIGAMFTATHRDFSTAPAMKSVLDRNALSGGLDWRIRFEEGRYAITGWAGASRIDGDTAAINRIQTSSSHYFQRPDAEVLKYNPLARSMSGYTASIRADKDAGKHILWGMQVITESPGYEINDVGRLQSADDIDYNADIQIRETLPGRFLQNWRLGFDTRGSYNYALDHQLNILGNSTTLTFRNQWGFQVRTETALRATDDALTRGGPVMGTGQSWSQEYRLTSPAIARTSWRLGAAWRRDELGGSRESVYATLTLRPAPRWQFSAEPTYLAQIDRRQYFTTLDDVTARLYSQRYIFAAIDRSTLSARLRLNYAFSPTLTLEGYAEPFVASGAYSGFGELSAPRSRNLRLYGDDGTTLKRLGDATWEVHDGASTFPLENRDFLVRSFRSNAVLRWEWTAGSTLFVVWQQNRQASEALGERVRFRNLWETTRAAGDNLLSVKLSYWLPLG